MRSAKKSSLVAALVVAGFPQFAAAQESFTRGDGSHNPAGNHTSFTAPSLPAPQPQRLPTSVDDRRRPRPVPSPGCYFLNTRSFTIPFTVDSSGARPAEIQLFTSRGQSMPWKQIDEKSPHAGVTEFQFSSDDDGEFWFATRTIDAVGQQHPGGPIRAELKVFVDTTKPHIVLDADADSSGRVATVVAIDDSTPLAIQLRYVTDSVKTWQSVDVGQLPADGKLSFTPQESWEQLSLQLIATDAANNQSVVSRLIQRPRMADTTTSRFASTQAADSVDASSAEYRVDSDGVRSRTVANPVIKLDRSTTTSNDAAANRYAANAPISGRSPFGGFRGAGQAPARALTRTILPPPASPDQISNGFGLIGPQQSASTPETKPSTPPAQGSAAGGSAARGSAARAPARTLAEAMHPMPTRPEGPSPASDSTKSNAAQKNNSAESIPTPAGQRDVSEDRHTARKSIDLSTAAGRAPIRYSDSLRFSLDYELEAIGSTGVESIELYGSVDGGKNWKYWGKDPDRISPFDIETKEEDVFGFRIVVVGRNGLASPRPLPNETPDIVVVVDKVKPVVRISGSQYGEGDRIGSLVIRFECEDANLLQRPITLSFSDSVDGPWTTIVAGLRNDGSYAWPADPRLPRQLYLRIDATDRAGNVGTYILDRAIDTQGLAPRARIRGFQSLSGGEPPAPGQQTANRGGGAAFK